MRWMMRLATCPYRMQLMIMMIMVIVMMIKMMKMTWPYKKPGRQEGRGRGVKQLPQD